MSTSADTGNHLLGYSYDAGGNMTSDGVNTYVYDGENRVSSVAGVSYAYDADGRRVKKSSGTNYWYGPSGEALAETDSAGTWTNYVFFGGMRLARNVNGEIKYYITDHLHSTAVFADKSGTVLDDNDFYPWGGVVPGVGQTTSNNTIKFTGKYRDTETGLDYFGARYYSNGLGRFITPDPLGGHYEDPQTLNKYAYIRNLPTTLTDPTGLDIWLQGCGQDSSTCNNNYVGTTDKDGNFQRTHLTGDQTKNATLGSHGITVTQDGKQYNGVWDTNKDENGDAPPLVNWIKRCNEERWDHKWYDFLDHVRSKVCGLHYRRDL